MLRNRGAIGLGGLALVVALMLLLTAAATAAPLKGAIFTTTPDGGIVNENTHYTAKIEVYLDGGPPPNAPARAAGLPEDLYVFQVTNPSGFIALSEDPAKCRIVHVSADGVIVELVPPSTLGLGLTDTYKANGNGGPDIDCHIQDGPDGAAGSSGQHDTNHDVDHWTDKGAITVQLMPFLDTPNPGGVYKAWMIPLSRYDRNNGDLDEHPKKRGVVKVKGDVKGFRPDPGYGPPRDQIKTDNFKIMDREPPVLLGIRKFNDLDADGVWDAGEPEIGVDQFIDASGVIVSEADGGGWPVDITDSLLVMNTEATPVEILAAPAGPYSIEEESFAIWVQSAAFLDGSPVALNAPVDLVVDGTPGETRVVIFGNFLPADLMGAKYEDLDGDGMHDAGEPGLAGVTVDLTGTDGMGGAVSDSTVTGVDGVFSFSDLKPGTYTVTETVPAGWMASTAISSGPHTLESGDSLNLSYVFGNFLPAGLMGAKYEDLDGDGIHDAGEPGLAGVTVSLMGTDGMGGAVSDSTITGAGGMFSFSDLKPGEYTVTEIVPAGWAASTPTSSGPHTLESGDFLDLSYVFGNVLPVDIHAHKFFDFDSDGVEDAEEEALAGVLICLEHDGAVVKQDAFGNSVSNCQTTNADGNVWWMGLSPGTYTIFEDLASSSLVGLSPTTATSVTVTLGSSESFTAVFGNVGACNGLTPGYWKNWRNHYTEAEFIPLLEGTIASTVEEADAIFDKWDASDPSDLTILKAFVLANQLTLNLTQNPDLPNPSDGSLFEGCLLLGSEGLGSLGDALEVALDIIANVGDYTDAQILDIKDILDAFANQQTG